jgi:hypothetical protein
MPWSMQDRMMPLKTHCKYPKLLKHGEIPYLKIAPRGEYTIPESDLYRLIANSHMPKAELFRDWLFEQVLPTIRKTGSYSVNPAASGLDYFKQAINAPFKLQKNGRHRPAGGAEQELDYRSSEISNPTRGNCSGKDVGQEDA